MVSHRSDVGCLNLRSTATIYEAQTRYGASIVIGCADGASKCEVSKGTYGRQLDHGTFEGNSQLFDPHVGAFRGRHGGLQRRTTEPGGEDRLKLFIRHEPYRVTESPLICLPIVALESAFPIVVAVAEMHRAIKIQIVPNVAVEVVGSDRVISNRVRARDGEIGLPPTSAAQLSSATSRLVIDDRVTQRLLDPPKVGARKMIIEFRKVVIAGAQLCGEDGFDHLVMLAHVASALKAQLHCIASK